MKYLLLLALLAFSCENNMVTNQMTYEITFINNNKDTITVKTYCGKVAIDDNGDVSDCNGWTYAKNVKSISFIK